MAAPRSPRSQAPQSPPREAPTGSTSTSSSALTTSSTASAGPSSLPISASASFPGGLARQSSSSTPIASGIVGPQGSTRPRGASDAPYPSSSAFEPSYDQPLASTSSMMEDRKPFLPYQQPRYGGRDRDVSPTDSAIDELEEGQSGELSPTSSAGGGSMGMLASDAVGMRASTPTYLPKTTSTLASLGGQPGGRTQATFVRKLFTMIEDLPEPTPSNGKPTPPLICWSRNGETFVVYNLTEFSGTILPQYFKHNNWQSFVRQLNMYGFHKVNDVLSGGSPTVDTSSGQAWEFQHPNFRRGRPDLFQHIKRKTAKQIGAGGQPSVATTPGIGGAGQIPGPSGPPPSAQSALPPPVMPGDIPHQHPLQPVMPPFYHHPPPPHGLPYGSPYLIPHPSQPHAHLHHSHMSIPRPPPHHTMSSPMPPGGPPLPSPQEMRQQSISVDRPSRGGDYPSSHERRPSMEEAMLPPPQRSRSARPMSSSGPRPNAGGGGAAASSAILPPPAASSSRSTDNPSEGDEVRGRPPPGTAQPRTSDAALGGFFPGPDQSRQPRRSVQEWQQEASASTSERPVALRSHSLDHPAHLVARPASASLEQAVEGVHRKLDSLTEQFYRTSQDTLAGKQNTVLVLRTILSLMSSIIDDPTKALAEIEAGRDKMREDVAMANDVIAKLEQQNSLEAAGMPRPLTALSTSSSGQMRSPVYPTYLPLQSNGPRPELRGVPSSHVFADHSPGSATTGSLRPSSTNSPHSHPQPYSQPPSHFGHPQQSGSRTFPPPPQRASSNNGSQSVRQGDWGPTLPSPSGPAPISIGAWLPPRAPVDNKRPYEPQEGASRGDAVGEPARNLSSSSSSARETPRSANLGSNSGLSLPPLSSLLGRTRPSKAHDDRDSKRVRYVG